MHGWKKWFVIAIAGGLFFVGGAFVLFEGANWIAEMRARAFCNKIRIGSNISDATSRADRENVLWHSGKVYMFLFPGAMFDSAACVVAVPPGGKVASKFTEMEYD